MAKIHTVDWTPAIIAHPTTVTGMRVNWWGLARRALRQAVRPPDPQRADPRDPRARRRATTACPTRSPRSSWPSTGCTRCSPTSSCFRALERRPRDPGADVPGDRRARTCASASRRCRSPTCSTRSGSRIRARSRCTTTRASCRSSTAPTGTRIDLAAIDILRTRERGVPRYNEFRRLFHLKPVETFEELTGDAGARRRRSAASTTATSSAST